MNQFPILQQLLLEKYQRQKSLSDKFKELEELDQHLSDKKIGRWFGTTYLVTKRIITLVIGIVVCLFALLLLIQPEILFDDKTVEEIVSETGEEQIGLMDEHIEFAWKRVYDGRPLNSYEFAKLIDNIIYHNYKEDFFLTIHLLGYLLLALGLITLYISRLTRKMWNRNRHIADAQGLSIELIEAFKAYIQEEEEEIARLEKLVNEDQNVSTS